MTNNEAGTPLDVQHEYASDEWASERGYYLATSFLDTQDGRMQQADDIAGALIDLRDHMQAARAADALRIAELESKFDAAWQSANILSDLLTQARARLNAAGIYEDEGEDDNDD